jgi:hypothetical protein
MHDTGPQPAGDFLGAVGATVVGDQDFTAYLVFLQSLHGFSDTDFQRFSLVEAWHENG